MEVHVFNFDMLSKIKKFYRKLIKFAVYQKYQKSIMWHCAMNQCCVLPGDSSFIL